MVTPQATSEAAELRARLNRPGFWRDRTYVSPRRTDDERDAIALWWQSLVWAVAEAGATVTVVPSVLSTTHQGFPADLVPLARAARLAGVHCATLTRAVRNGELTGYPVPGRPPMISETQALAWSQRPRRRRRLTLIASHSKDLPCAS